MPSFAATCAVKWFGPGQQIPTKTHASLIQSGMSFGWNLFFAGLAANVAADGAQIRLEAVAW